MKTYTIQVEDTVAELFEEVAAMFQKPATEIMSDVLFLRAEDTKAELEKKFIVGV